MGSVKEDDRHIQQSSISCPRVCEIETSSDPEGYRVRRVDFNEHFKCLVSTEPDQLLARLTWCIDSGLADGAREVASFQQALFSSDKFRRFEDFIRLNNGALDPPILCVDFTIIGFEVHISALSLAAAKFAEILAAMDLADVDGRTITIENSSASSPENETLAALVGKEHRFARLLSFLNRPISLSRNGLSERISQLMPTRRKVLIVRGAQDVDQLIRIAQKFVSLVKCPKPVIDLAGKREDPMTAPDIENIKKMVVICSSAMPRLVVTWLLPGPDANDYRCKPLNYLAYLVQQEYCGGLLHQLREQDLASHIQVVVPEDSVEINKHWSVFRVIFMLTSRGVLFKERILAALFDYLSHIQRDDILEWIYGEAAMSCRLKSEYDSQPYLRSRKTLCRAILNHAPEDCFDRSHLMLEFDPQLISSTISRLSRSAFNVILEGDFDVSDFPDAEAHPSVGLIMDMPIIDRGSGKWSFTRYEPNELMPRKLEIRREQRFVENYPNVISKSGSHRLWYQFRDLNSPKVFCFLNFVGEPVSSAKWFVSAELACALLERELLTRRSAEAGIDLQGAVTSSGISISIDAANESLDTFMGCVVRRIRSTEISPKLFSECHADMIESYRLRTTNAGLAENMFEQMHSGELDLHKKIAAAEALQAEDIANVRRDMSGRLFRDCFIFGNYSSDDALQTGQVIDELGSDPRFPPPKAAPLENPRFEDRFHPGSLSDRKAIFLLYYQWKGISDVRNAFFLEILTDFFNSRIRIGDCAVYCMPRSRNEESTGFTVELACDKESLDRNRVLLERTLIQLVTEFSDDQDEIAQAFSSGKKRFKRCREATITSKCSLMAREARAHFTEIVNATYRFGKCFEIENAANSLESGVFYNWIQEAIASGCLRQPACRVRVG
ncbi:insulin-degrading enzyme-like 1, peroxisomal [Galendromus occidentalis]|uniref:Insulin-degrading enzyme-like 1, peroxisomal n=1 Tax=Galendromus occidentalis TaxID=34638 RepID=A0AAJ6QU15_9ACAR|nr:insulin-degrading enzyme-like 1, peroxisomal [Galendromus occidentalis]